MSTFWVSTLMLISLALMMGIAFELSSTESESRQEVWQPVRILENEPQRRDDAE